MMEERGVEVDPSTLFRWVQRYAHELEKRVRAYQGYGSTSWTHTRLSDDEDCYGYHRRFLDHAHDPPRTLPHLQARRED